MVRVIIGSLEELQHSMESHLSPHPFPASISLSPSSQLFLLGLFKRIVIIFVCVRVAACARFCVCFHPLLCAAALLVSWVFGDVLAGGMISLSFPNA